MGNIWKENLHNSDPEEDTASKGTVGNNSKGQRQRYLDAIDQSTGTPVEQKNMAGRRTGNLMTQEQYKELQRYFLLEHKECVDNYDKDAFQRLQLRLLCLMLGQLHGNPTVEELLDTRHSDIKAYKMDMNAPSLRVLSVGEEGTGPHTMMYIRSGPDENGMFVSFSAALHKDPNLCCISALGDLLIYESNPGSPDPGIFSWVADNSKSAPYLFHAFEDPNIPLTKEWVRAELSKGLAVIAGTDVCVDDIGRSSVMWMLNAGVSEREATRRCLAPPLPQVPQGVMDRLLGKDFLFTLSQLKKDCFQAAPWKLQEFGERWPLAGFDLVHSSQFKKYVTKTMREVNSLSGCAGCGAKEEEGTGALLKCSRCRLVVYCNRECQRAHWSTHKPECKPLVPSKKEIKQKKKGKTCIQQEPRNEQHTPLVSPSKEEVKQKKEESKKQTAQGPQKQEPRNEEHTPLVSPSKKEVKQKKEESKKQTAQEPQKQEPRNEQHTPLDPPSKKEVKQKKTESKKQIARDPQNNHYTIPTPTLARNEVLLLLVLFLSLLLLLRVARSGGETGAPLVDSEL